MSLQSPNPSVEVRIFRFMIGTVIPAALLALVIAPWRVTTGLIFGGALSLLNYRWLIASTSAVLHQSVPRIRVLKYILRYAVIGGGVVILVKFQAVSLTATILGLCSFVPAFFVEASVQTYFAIVNREESF